MTKINFSMCIGGLRYNISSFELLFYDYYGKEFECQYSPDGFDITVTEELLTNSMFYDSNSSVCVNHSVYLLDKVIRHCLDYNRMIIHGAALMYKGNGYLFVAPSGTGKSTHAGLWKKYLGSDVSIINGDKPMLEFGDKIIIHGTPWKGKENIGQNISAPLRGIVVIKQSLCNSFRCVNASESVVSLLRQCFYSVDKELGPKVVACIGRIVNDIPIFALDCNISKEAFMICFQGLRENIMVTDL